MVLYLLCASRLASARRFLLSWHKGASARVKSTGVCYGDFAVSSLARATRTQRERRKLAASRSNCSANLLIFSSASRVGRRRATHYSNRASALLCRSVFGGGRRRRNFRERLSPPPGASLRPKCNNKQRALRTRNAPRRTKFRRLLMDGNCIPRAAPNVRSTILAAGRHCIRQRRRRRRRRATLFLFKDDAFPFLFAAAQPVYAD